MSTTDNAKEIRTTMRDTDATKLVCLPYAGAGASFYRPWTAVAGDALEIVALQLPGRERLIDEEPYRDAHRAVDGLLAQLRERLGDGGGRVALFGHSLGAVLAYELAHRLAAEPGVEPVHLFVSGSPAPGQGRARRATGLSDDEFLARVGEFAGYRHPAFDDPEMRELLLPALRADVEMHENHRPSTELPWTCPSRSSGARTTSWSVTTTPCPGASRPAGTSRTSSFPAAICT